MPFLLRVTLTVGPWQLQTRGPEAPFAGITAVQDGCHLPRARDLGPTVRAASIAAEAAPGAPTARIAPPAPELEALVGPVVSRAADPLAPHSQVPHLRAAREASEPPRLCCAGALQPGVPDKGNPPGRSRRRARATAHRLPPRGHPLLVRHAPLRSTLHVLDVGLPSSARPRRALGDKGTYLFDVTACGRSTSPKAVLARLAVHVVPRRIARCAQQGEVGTGRLRRVRPTLVDRLSSQTAARARAVCRGCSVRGQSAPAPAPTGGAGVLARQYPVMLVALARWPSP
jgi:hypothetical protein